MQTIGLSRFFGCLLVDADKMISGKVRTRMRFQAAVCLLQLAQVPAFAQQIVPNFNMLALTVQVSPKRLPRRAFTDRIPGPLL